MKHDSHQPVVTYLGPVGTYSEEAAHVQYGEKAVYEPRASINEAIRAVKSKKADVAVVPIENSTEGAVKDVYEHLLQTPLQICGEIFLPIHHQLQTKAGSLADIQEVVAHPQALAQCRAWLDKHLPSVRQTPVASNGEAARLAAKNESIAAIASERAAHIYQVPILEKNIEDDPSNTTRFVMLGAVETEPSGMMLAKRYICDLTPYEPGKPIELVARQYGISPDKIIKLASNENPLGPSPKALQALQTASLQAHRYPEQYELLQALAKHLGVEANSVVLGNGSNDVLDLIARTYLAPGDEAISSQYAFAIYQIAIQTTGAKNVVVPAKDYAHDLDAMLAAVTSKTKVIWIANPNNPTGTFIPYAQIKQFLEKVSAEIVVVLDEAYYEYLDPDDRGNSVAWIAEHPNLILTRTFSKIYGLAGLRIGYAIASPGIAELLNRVRHPFNVNSLAIKAAIAALGDRTFTAMSYQQNKDGIAQLKNGFERLNLHYLPAFGNFITVKVPDTKEVYEKLLQQGAIVRSLASYKMVDFLRITVGTSDENTQLLAALETSVRPLKKQ